MTQISMDKDLASDLIDSKLRSIKKQISEILDKWQQSSVEEMMLLSRSGKLPESELDAIALTNLQQKMFELEKFHRNLEE